jgi:RNA polymerase sigma factor (sigma-70 family)
MIRAIAGGWTWAMAILTPAPQPVQPDDALVRQALRGDRRAYDDLYRRHVDDVWRWLTRLIGSDPEREDLTQQIFLDLFRNLSSWRGEASFRTYLHRVVVNVAYDHLRRRGRRRRETPLDDTIELTAPEPSPEAAAAQRQRIAQTWTCLDQIKPKKRVAFVLRVVEGQSLQEIANAVMANVPTVAQRIAHAQRELMDMLRRHDRRPRDGEGET